MMGWWPLVAGWTIGNLILWPFLLLFTIVAKTPIFVCRKISEFLDRATTPDSMPFWRRWRSRRSEESLFLCLPAMIWTFWLLVALVWSLFGAHDATIAYNLQMIAIATILLLAIIAVSEWRRGYSSLPSALLFGIIAACIFPYSATPSRVAHQPLPKGGALLAPAHSLPNVAASNSRRSRATDDAFSRSQRIFGLLMFAPPAYTFVAATVRIILVASDAGIAKRVEP